MEAPEAPQTHPIARGDNEMLEFTGRCRPGTGYHWSRSSIASMDCRKVIFPNCARTWWGNGICCAWPSNLKSGHYLRLGRGEERAAAAIKRPLLVDSLEAILAALYLDGGWTAARDFILRDDCRDRNLLDMNVESSAIPVMDFKSALQEKLQAGG